MPPCHHRVQRCTILTTGIISMNEKKISYDTILYLLTGDVQTGNLRTEEVLKDLRRLINTLGDIEAIIRYFDNHVRNENSETDK